ncbi:MAG: geranylgeranyl reductase family protein [Candidatus Helarchaeota archaeon]
MYDTIVCGAGPAGAFAAKKLAYYGYKVLLLEKKKVPRDKPCGGWITNKVFEYLEWNPSDIRDITVEPISKGVLWINEGDNKYNDYSTDFKRPVSYGIRRIEFDEKIVNDAIINGADFIDETAVKDIIISKDKVLVKTSYGRDLEARILIGADGTYSIVAKKVRVRDKWSPEELSLCCVSETKIGRNKNSQLTPHFGAPELFFNFNTKGYSWFYTKGDYLNVGTGMRLSLHSPDYTLTQQYNDFLELLRKINHYNGEKLSPIKGHSYAVFNGPYNYKTFRRRVFLIGDAAGFAINLTGEGIRPAIISADLATKTIKKVLESPVKENISKFIFKQYESNWKKELGIEYAFGSIAQSFYKPNLFPMFKSLIKNDEKFRALFFKICFNIGNPRNVLRDMLLRAPILVLKLANQGFRSIINSILGRI